MRKKLRWEVFENNNAIVECNLVVVDLYGHKALIFFRMIQYKYLFINCLRVIVRVPPIH